MMTLNAELAGSLKVIALCEYARSAAQKQALEGCPG